VEYAVLISYIDPNDATNAISIILDTVNDTNITASSTVTEHPTVNGTPMADHMYKNPIDLTLNGTFSLNGRKATMFSKERKSFIRNDGTFSLDTKRAIAIDKTGTSLIAVEQTFEDIKNKGILCTISKIKIADDFGVPQFTVRENMVLQSITWTEKINSLGFIFTFREALRADIQTYNVDPSDRFAPDITYADASSFSDTLLDWDAVDKEVLQALINYKLAADDFLKYLATISVGSLIAIGIGAAIATVLTSTLVALGMAISTIPIVGAVVAAVAAVVIGVIAIVKLVKERAYKIKAFKYYKNATKRDKEVKRFMKFYDSIHNKIRTLDGAIKLWSVSENKSQETLVNIDGSYYIFNFEKNNVDSGFAYKLNVSDINDTTIKCTNTNAAINSFTDCTDNDMLFKTSKSRVYLIRSNGTNANDLTSYFICASQISPNDFSEALTKIIQEAIKY
jgi:hypothetical protein